MVKRPPPPDPETARDGVLLSLNGLSLWFLSVLVDAYLSGSGLPWETVSAFVWGLHYRTLLWMVEPGITVLEATAYLGIALGATGPVVAFAGRWAVDRLRQPAPEQRL